MYKLVSVLTGFLFLIIGSPCVIACSCAWPKLQEVINKSDTIVLATIKNVAAKRPSSAPWNDVELGSSTLSVLRVLKGQSNASEIFVPEIKYGYCICSIAPTSKGIKELDGTKAILFLNENNTTNNLISCEDEKGCADLLQRIAKMVDMQRRPDWGADERMFEWLTTCMASDETWPFVWTQFFEARAATKEDGYGLNKYVLKDFSKFVSVPEQKRLSDSIYPASIMNCRQAHSLLLAANWDNEKVLAPALDFLRNQVAQGYRCTDDNVFLLPNLMRLIADKTQNPEAQKFAGMLLVRDTKEVLSEFLNFIENENKKRRQRKIAYVIASIVSLVGLAFVSYKLLKRNLIFVSK